MTDQLARCPFCGSTDVYFDEFCFIGCKKCNTFGPDGETEEEAIAAWNHRPIETVLRGEVETLRAKLAELKARTCETCRWIGDHGDGPLCHKDGVDVYFVANNFCCSAWERKEQP